MNRMKKKLSIQDIADLAKVSKSTVSRYLNNGYVKEETKKKIAKIIKEHNYEPNHFARLKAKDSKIIGVIAPCLDSSVTSQVLMEIDAQLQKENYMSLFINTNHDGQEELRYMESLAQMNVAGIILNATQVSSEHAQIAKQLSIPMVFVAQHCKEGISIINEDYQAGQAMGEYIAKNGIQDVLLMSVSERDVAVGVQRKQGIVDALHKHSIKHMEILISDFSYENTYNHLTQKLEKHIPEIIICSTTKQLLGTYRCLRDKKLRIPHDVSVVGFCDQQTSEMLEPIATSIHFCPKKTGQLSAKAMLSLLHHETIEPIQSVDFEWIEGESVKRRMP